MKTLICINPGKLEYKTTDKPEIAKGRSIIKIKRIGICGTDLHAFEGTQPFFEYPRILGHELSGELVAIDDAPGFSVGDAITFIPYFSCGKCIACRSLKPNCCVNIKVSGVHEDGGMAEYLSVPSYSLVHSRGLNFDSLALVEPLAIGAHAVARAGVKPGEYVLVAGAGPIGLGTMEFARIAGGEVIALDINRKRLQFCRDRLKVNHIIDAKDTNVMQQLRDITDNDLPTVVIDATGNLSAIQNAFQYIAHGGRYIMIGLQKGDVCLNHPEFHKREATLMSSRNATRTNFEQVIGCMISGQISPVTYITHKVSFGEAKHQFVQWLEQANGVIKAMIEVD